MVIPQSDTLNPFEISNGQFFGNGTTIRVDNTSDASDAGLLSSSSNNSPYNTLLANSNRELYNLTQQSHEENKLELADLRRQVVYLQVFARCPYMFWHHINATTKWRMCIVFLHYV